MAPGRHGDHDHDDADTARSPFDPRMFARLVYLCVKQVPRGKVAAYGQVGRGVWLCARRASSLAEPWEGDWDRRVLLRFDRRVQIIKPSIQPGDNRSRACATTRGIRDTWARRSGPCQVTTTSIFICLKVSFY